MGRIIICLLFFCAAPLCVFAQKKAQISSPDGNVLVIVDFKDKIYYSVYYGDDLLLKDGRMALNLKNAPLGESPKLISQKQGKVNEELRPVVPLKRSVVKNEYNRLLLAFQGNYQVEFRVYDDGFAYRFITKRKGDVEVMGEELAVDFPAQYTLHMQQPGGFKTAYEEPYSAVASADWKPSDNMAVLPILIETDRRYSILVSESGLHDYPAMFLKGSGQNGIESAFPKQPLEFGEDGDRSLKILKEADYIAKTSGSRAYPWRYFVIAKDASVLLENTMTFKLASQNCLEDVSWIKPGKASWEWWNDASPYGPDVDFESGYNLETYKYYIDFAAKYGIEYIIMDEGWAMDTRDPYTPNPKVDVHELIRYGKEKNVGIILWLTWLTVEKNMDLFKTFAEWGVKGVKIDFMERSDQHMVNYYEKVAEEAAKHKMFVDFHGSFKPAGLEYKYPNVLSYEGVRGLEQMGGCYPDNTIWLPFIRNAAGPMDFTPGAMINMQPDVYSARRPNSGAMGTRAFQVALFVLFESGLQMLADNPTLYYRNPECTEFIAGVPVTWDETKALAAEIGQYAVVAKRKADKWFIGGITNGNQRELELNLDFLEIGRKYKMTVIEDGPNAGRQAMDYRRREADVKKGDKVNIKMARNGGWAAVIE